MSAPELLAIVKVETMDAALELRDILEGTWDEFHPVGPTAYVNGRLPQSMLAPIGGGYYLRKDAAAAYNAMRVHIHAKTGFWISVVAGYRTYARQVYFWNLYRSGRGNLAAYPGSSNHGLGAAIDLANQTSRHYVDLYGAPYGWAKRWSDAPGEWWHIKFDASRVRADVSTHTAPVLRQGQTGHSIKSLQVRLRKLGFKSVPAPNRKGYGYFGATTKSAVKRIQKKHHLPTDGIVGPRTRKAIW